MLNRPLEPAGFLSVEPGDVVGLAIPRSGRSGRIQLNGDYHDESTWFTVDIVSGQETCVGQGGFLRNFSSSAPVLSVAISKLFVSHHSCYTINFVSHLIQRSKKPLILIYHLRE